MLRAHSIWVSSHTLPKVWLPATPAQSAAVHTFASRAAQFTGQGQAWGLMTLGTYRQQCTLLYDGAFYVRGKRGGVRSVMIVPTPGAPGGDGVFRAIHSAL
jgi:hypothetical protein